MNIRKVKKAKEVFLDIAEKAIVNEVEKIFKKHKELISYDDNMGLCSFEDKDGEGVFLTKEVYKNYRYIHEPTYEDFETLLDIYDEVGNITFGINLTNKNKS